MILSLKSSDVPNSYMFVTVYSILFLKHDYHRGMHFLQKNESGILIFPFFEEIWLKKENYIFYE